MSQFIEVYKNAYSPEFCDAVVDSMEKAFSRGFGISRQTSDIVKPIEKEDLQIFAHQSINGDSVLPEELHQKFSEVFWKDIYTHYSQKFGVLHTLAEHGLHGSKLQKTDVGQGYHIWHCEHNGNSGAAKRILNFIVYLNDVDEGGETEFLYQHLRVKPEKGTAVVFPAMYTHAHRGNTPLSNSKYIMTSWVEF
jgi:hypothetical protein